MSCAKCGDVCKCINITSTDGSMIVIKNQHAYGCEFDIKQNGDSLYILEFDDTTRRLCLKNTQGLELDCVTIPDGKQSLSIENNILSISDGNSITLPHQEPITINSSSIRVQQGGDFGENILLEVEPSADASNALMLGSDGKLYVPQSEAPDNTFDEPVTFNAEVTANAPVMFSTFSASGDANLQRAFLTDIEASGNADLNNVTVNGEFGINQGGVIVYPTVYRGDYNPTTLYFLNNVVTYGNQLWTYYFPSASAGNTPVDGSTYWKLFDTSTGTPGADGKTTEIRFAVNGSSVTAPALTNTDQNPAGWALNPPAVGQAEYLWMTKAEKNSDGTLVDVWSTPVRLSGLMGPAGSQGDSSNMPFPALAFKRSTTQPATPTDGSWNTPTPSGWSDGIPAGSLQLWMIKRTFTQDGLTPQDNAWSTPVAVTDTTTVDYEFSSVATSPGTPSTAPGNWHNIGTEDDIWMAVRTIDNGVAGAWQVLKIKGENGQDGAQGIPGQVGPAGPFLSYSGNWDPQKVYYGNEDRITSVFYNGNYYVTRTDAGGNIPAGTVPTNTLYWDPIQGNYDSIATGLLLAQVAYINNLAVSFLRTGAPQPGVSGTEHIEIYPSFATLQGFRTNGEPGYDGLTDDDLHFLANSIILFGIDDTGARDRASVTNTMYSKWSALSATDSVEINTDQFNNGVPVQDAWDYGPVLRMQAGQNGEPGKYAGVLSNQGLYLQSINDFGGVENYSTLTSEYLISPTITARRELRTNAVVPSTISFGGQTFLIQNDTTGENASGYLLQRRSPTSLIITNLTGGPDSQDPTLNIPNQSAEGTDVTNPVSGAVLYTIHVPVYGQVFDIVSINASGALSLDTDVKIFLKDGTTATTSLALGIGKSIRLMALGTQTISGSTNTTYIEL